MSEAKATEPPTEAKAIEAPAEAKATEATAEVKATEPPAASASAPEPAAVSGSAPEPPAAELADTAAVAPAATAAAADAPGGLLPSTHWAVAPQIDAEDSDSALGDDPSESTASLASSIRNYRNIHGRTYHSEIGNANYWGANDEEQNDAMDMGHHMLLMLADHKLYFAPIVNPQKAIDIGTGTGMWAIDFADEHPECEVIGTDVSPIQPSWVPPNLKFQIEDCTQSWTFPENEFDYVHIRYLTGSIQDWNAFFKEAYRVIKPGGWLENFEGSTNIQTEPSSAPLPKNSAIGQWGPIFINGSKSHGRSFTVVEDHTQKTAMEAAGFINIEVKDIKLPLGSWPADNTLRNVGIFSRHVMKDTIGYIGYITKEQGWSAEQGQVYAAYLQKEIAAGEHHTYFNLKSVWGQKPAT